MLSAVFVTFAILLDRTKIMIVCIAEKPSVARDIADVLGAKNKKDGYIEGNGYQVTWTFGHLCTLKEPHEYTPSWKAWSLSSLPMIPPRFGIKLINDPGIEKQFRIIESLMQKADEIINCGDAGQEGELIQRWVMQKAGAHCPVKRLWISSLTEEAIREGFQNLKDQSDFKPLYEAGLSRAIGDWVLGMNATRLYTLKYGQNRQVLSIGRVQTPTLALIVKRQLEIENFTPQQYWVLATVYRDTTFTAIIRKSDEELAQEESDQKESAKKSKRTVENRGIPPITDLSTGEALMERIKNVPFTVTEVTKKAGTEAPPRLFDLTSLQVECNKKFGYSADDTLKLIQSLYEKKVTTYPRVDTTFLSDDIYPKCPGILAGLKPYETLTAPLAGTKLNKSKKVFDNSKVTVAVMPEAEEVELEINPKDLRIDTFRSSGAGGQHINKTSSAIRVTHLPTGMVVECQDQRSQRENKDRALKVLRSRLLQQKQDAYDEEYNARRQSQVGSGDRSEKIRTYNFPQDRVTDHRIGLTLRNLQGVLDGDLDRVVEPLILADREEKLKQSSTEEGK